LHTCAINRHREVGTLSLDGWIIALGTVWTAQVKSGPYLLCQM